MRPADTSAALKRGGFTNIQVAETSENLQGYNAAITRAERSETPIFGMHILLGKQATQIV